MADLNKPSSRHAPAEHTPIKGGFKPFTERESILIKYALAEYRHQIGVRGKVGPGGFDALTPGECDALAEFAATRARKDKLRIRSRPASVGVRHAPRQPTTRLLDVLPGRRDR